MSKLADELDRILKPRRHADEPASPQIEQETTEFDFGGPVDMATVFHGDNSEVAEELAAGPDQEQTGVMYHSPDEGIALRTNSGELDLIHEITTAVDELFHHHMQENPVMQQIAKALTPERLIAIKSPASPHWYGGQVTIPLTNSVNAERVCEKRTERRSITIVNNNATVVLLASTSAVNVTSFRLAANGTIVIPAKGEVWAATATGAPAVTLDYFETFDDPAV